VSYQSCGASEMMILFLTLNMSQAPVAGYHVKYNLAAFELEAEVELAQSGVPHGIAQLRFVFFAIQHQKSATTRATYFSSDGAVLLR
jgi:hypothetical protein